MSGPRFLLRAQKVILEDRALEEGAVLVVSGRVAEVGPARTLAAADADRTIDHDGLVVPGFVDLQVNGQAGRDVMEGRDDALSTIRLSLARRGTTAFLATTISARVDEELIPLLRRLAALLTASGTAAGSEMLGIHCEGPFLARVNRGAHDPSRLEDPTPGKIARIVAAAGGWLRLVTLAPELPGGLSAVEALVRAGVRVAMGHTSADAATVARAAELGMTLCTHLFNAMAPFSHRSPGPAGAVLANDHLTASLIPDGVHLHPSVVKIVLAAKGPAHALAVTDSTAAAGMADGRYRLGPGWIEVGGGVCRDGEGRLAGSALTMDRAFANLVAFTGCSVVTAARLTSLNAARLLGVDARKGSIAAGKDADLLCLDGSLRLVRTFCRGTEAT